MIENEDEEANQSNFVPYLHGINFQKGLKGNSVEYAVEYGKRFHMMKNADVIKVERLEHKQKKTLLE